MALDLFIPEMGEEEAIRCARNLVRGRGCAEGEQFLKIARAIFPGKTASWYMRVIARCLVGAKRVAKYHWILPGIKPLRDRYPYYNVVLTDKGEWFCDCFTRRFGWRRREKMCTHVAAIVILRKAVKGLETW